MQQNNGAGLSSFGTCFYDEGDGSLTKTISVNDLYFSLSIYAVVI